MGEEISNLLLKFLTSLRSVWICGLQNFVKAKDCIR